MKLKDIKEKIRDNKRKVDDKPSEIRKRYIHAGLTQDAIAALVEKENEPLIKERERLLFELDQKNELIRQSTNWLLVVIALGTSIATVCFSYNDTKTNEKLNRPYLEIDASSTTPDLINENFDTRRLIEGKPPFPLYSEDSFSFTIKNVGKLPARYTVDTSELYIKDVLQILPPSNQEGIIFPDQIIKINYDIKGEVLLGKAAEFKRITSTIFINYSLIEDEEWRYQTIIQEDGEAEQNCNTIPPIPPSVARCFGFPKWNVKYIK